MERPWRKRRGNPAFRPGTPANTLSWENCCGEDAQLADRNTKTYDLLVGHPEDKHLQKVQVKTVRAQPWYVKQSSFEGELIDQVTVYVMIGKEDGNAPVRYFIARNRDIAGEISIPSNWKDNGFMMLKSLRAFEGRWSALSEPAGG
jgi:hypothetical protein